MDAIAELTNVDFPSVLMAVFTILVGLKAILSCFEWVILKLGLETKWMKKRRKEQYLLVQTAKSLAALQEKHHQDVAASQKADEKIAKDIVSLTSMVNDISITLKQMQEKNNETKLKEIKGSLIRYYNRFKDAGEWSALEKDAFWDLFDDYEKRGGDGYIHSIVEPVMRELKEIDSYHSILK